MPVPLSVNGAVFNYPQNFDTNWGIDATGWAQAVTSGMLQKAGGSFPLAASVDFGNAFGMKVLNITSETINPASTGYIRLAKTDAIEFRNNANSANLPLTIDGSDNLTFNGIVVGTAASVTNIFGTANEIIASAPNGNVTLSTPQAIAPTSSPTFANLTLTSLTTSAISSTSSPIASAGFIRLSNSGDSIAWRNAGNTSDLGLSVNGANQLTFGTFGLPIINGTFAANHVATWSSASTLGYPGLTDSVTTTTELSYLSGVTSAVQPQINSVTTTANAALPRSGGTMSGSINMAGNTIVSLPSATIANQPIVYGQSSAVLSGLNVSSQKVTSVANGTTASDAVNFGQLKIDLLGTATASSSASISFSGLAGASYAYYEVQIDNLQSGTDAVSFHMQLSTGSGFLTTNYSYENLVFAGTTSSVTSATSQSSFDVMDGAGTGAGVIQSVKLSVFGAENTTTSKRSIWTTTGFYQSGLFFTTTGGGVVITNAAVIDGIKFFMSTGNIATGTFRVYGYRNS